MGSYVISVSLCTGCYRHIRISENAPLFMLHETILKAFDFDDDHLHAFFLDDHYWSHNRAYFSDKEGYWSKKSKKYTLQKLGLKEGDKFKYLFDFGDEWRFQCRVLRREDEETVIPCIVRSVGESPEQYPDEDEDYDYFDFDDEDEDYDEDEEYEKELEAWKATLPQILSEKKLRRLYSELPVNKEAVAKLRRYCTAVARVYGVAPVTLAHELYCKYEEPLKLEDYLACVEVFRHEELCFAVLGSESLYQLEAPSAPADREIVYKFLLLEGPEMYYFITDLRAQKPMFPIQREELLDYAEDSSIPKTLQAQAMLHFLIKELRDKDSAEKLTFLLTCMAAAECHISNVMEVLEEIGIILKPETLRKFLDLYKELNNHTRKFANCGFTPSELFSNSKPNKNHEDQISLF